MAGEVQDEELMLLVREDDESAFEELAGRYRRPLISFFYSLCWNPETAQDCAQEVLLKLWLARSRYEPSGKLSHYLFKIAANHWRMVLRQRRCRPSSISLSESWEPSVEIAGLEKVLLRRYEYRCARQAIDALPEHYRIVFVLSHFQGMTYADIGEVLGIPVGTVKSRMSKAVRLLRDKLSTEMRDE